MPVFNNALAGAAGSGGASGYKIERSLRFNRDDDAYLSRTFTAGNRKTWTWSGWVKLGREQTGGSSNRYTLFECTANFGASGNPYGLLNIVSGMLGFGEAAGGAYTTALFRDHSAWYHVVAVMDTTQSTPADRLKLYVNGVQHAHSGYTFGLNANTAINQGGIQHNIGREENSDIFLADYLLADVHFIDGQALAPTDFGEYDDNNVWQPKSYTHSATIDYSGNNQITIDPGNYYLNGLNGPNAFNGDGFTYIDSRLGTGSNNTTNIIWQPTGGIANVTKIRVHTNYATHYRINNGTWTSFSSTGTYAQIYSGTAFTLTKLEIRRDNCQASDWGHRVTFYEINDVEYQNVGLNSFHLDFDDNSSAAALGYDAAGSNDWTVNNLSVVNGTGSYTVTRHQYTTGVGDQYDPYHSVDGDLTTSYADRGYNNNGLSFSGLPQATQSIRIDCNIGGGTTTLNANHGSSDVRTFTASATDTGRWKTMSGTVSSSSPYTLTKITGDGGNESASYFALYAIEIDGVIVVDNRFNAGNDSLLDSPTNYEADSGNNGGNYATLNPLQTGSGLTLSNGNLDLDGTSSWKSSYSTIFLSSGKWYTEYTIRSITTHSYGILVGLAGLGTNTIESEIGSSGDSYAIQNGPGDMKVNYNGTSSGQGPQAAYVVGDVLQLAWDADNGKLFFGKNGSWINSANPVTGANAIRNNLTGTYCFAVALLTTADKISANFGQRPFTHTPPTGYKAICTKNLDDPLIPNPSTAFDVLKYDGITQSPRTVTGLGITEPDLVWVKRTNDSSPPLIWDRIRGTDKNLRTDTSNNESAVSGSSNGIISDYAANGFVVKDGSGSGTNVGSSGTNPYVAWAWDCGSSNTQISVGSLNSSFYNQDQNWTSLYTTSSGSMQNPGGSFDGDTSTQSYILNATATWEVSTAFTVNDKVEIFFNNNSNTSFYITSDGSNWTEVTGIGGATGWRTVMNSGSFKGFRTTQSDATSTSASVKAVRIDGVLLIDSGVSLSGFTQYPSIASTVRANQSTGCSIVTYTGTQASGSTVAHGLNKAPEFWVMKSRSGSGMWVARHKDVANTHYLQWDDTYAPRNAVSDVTGDADATSALIPIGAADANNNTQTYVAYCWTPIEGFSAMGKYDGNSNANGPFIYTGFQPAWIMIKNVSTNGYPWHIYDDKRNGYNFENLPLYVDLHDQEGTSGFADILSNGFKIRSSSQVVNVTGEDYIWMAFASNPFKTARAR